MQSLENIISLNEAAKISGYTQDYLGSLIRSGEMKGVKKGGVWFTTEREVKDYISNQKNSHKTLTKLPRKKLDVKELLSRPYTRNILVFTFLLFIGFSSFAFAFNKISNLPKGSVSFATKQIATSLQSTSSNLAYGWSAFTNGILNNITDSVNGTKEFANSTKNFSINISLPKIQIPKIQTSSLTASVGDSLTTVGNSLQSTSGNLAYGWESFTDGILNNITDALTTTKEFAVSVLDGAKLIGNGIDEGWTSTKNFIANLFTPKTNSLAVVPIIKIPTPITPPAQTPPVPLSEAKPTPITPVVVETPTPTNSNTPSPTVITKTIIQYITEQPQTTIINQFDPTLLSRIQGIELALQNNISHNSTQTDRTYDSVGASINGAVNSITESGTLNDSTLNDSLINDALITNGILTGSIVFTHAPTLPHAFDPSWPSDVSNVSDSPLYINPASAVADGNLIGAAVGGVAKFIVDAEGDVYAKNVILTGSTVASSTTIGTLNVEGNTTLGDAGTDTLIINGATTVNSTAWTFANDTNFALTGGVNGLSFDTDTLSIDSLNHRIGIGTTSPGAPLEVVGQVTINNGALFHYTNTDNAAVNYIRALKSRGTYASPSAILDGDDVLRIEGNSFTSGTTYGYSVRISGESDGGSGVGSSPGKLSFFTTPTGSTNALERLTIRKDGNVGIGITAPTAILNIKAGSDIPNGAPLKLTSGALTTGANITAGSIEFLTDAYYGTISTGPARKTFAFLESPAFTTPSLGAATSTGLSITSANTTEVTTASALALNVNSLTTGTGFYTASSSLSSGSLFNLAVTGTAGLTNQKGINVSLSGANATLSQTTYGAYLSNTHTGTSTNVGLYATATGGTNNYAAIFGNGNVGIGLTAPGEKLSVAGNVMIGDATWSAGTTTGDLAIQGNVGIGTTGPVGKLDVSGGMLYTRAAPSVDSTVEQIRIGRSDSDIRYSSIYSSVSATASLNKLSFLVHNVVTTTSQAEVLTLQGNGNVGIGQTSPGSRLVIKGKSLISTDSALNVTDSGDTSLMFIQNNGNVGIGTTSPGKLLELSSSSMPVIKLSGTNDAGTSGSGGLDIYGKDTSGTIRENASIMTAVRDNGAATYRSDLDFSVNVYGVFTKVMRISGNGFVGIGTNTIASKLGVLGNLAIGGTYGALAAPAGGVIIEGNVGIGTTNPGAKLDIANSTILGAEIRLREGTTNGVSYIGLKAPDAITTAVTYQWPEAPGTSGFVLASTTAGVMSWVDNAAGTGMTNPMLAVGDLIYASVAGTPATPAKLGIGTAGQVLETYDSGAGVMLPRWGSGGGLAVGGDGTPAGQIQFSTGGGVQAMDGDDEFYYNTTNQELSIIGSKAGSKRLQVTNTLEGASADSGINLGNNSGADQLSLRINSSAFDTYGGYSYLWSKANAPMVFGVNDAEAMRIAADGSLVVIGSITGAGGAFTTLTSSGATTLGTGASSINTIGSTTTPGTLTLHGATTLDSTFAQTGANTFGTGTGAVSLNGATTVTGSNTFNVGTGTTTLGGNLTVTGTDWTATPTISGLITATSGITSAGALIANGTSTFNNTISQTGANTFSTGTGAVSLNGATTVTGLLTANNFASSSSAITGGTITGTTINNSTIGITTPVAGNFTTIGITTQGSGAFTTLTASTSLLSPTFDTATAVAMNIGTATQNALTLGRVGATTAIAGSTITLGSATTTAISLGNITTNPTLTLLGTGVTTLGGTLQVGNGSVGGAVARFTNSSGYCEINPLTASLVCTSDINLKKNIVNIKDGIEFALKTVPSDIASKSTFEKLMTLTPVTYNWKTEGDSAGKHVGFIAQEVEQVFPDLVFTDSVTGLKSIAFTNLIPYTISAMQEMNLKVEDLSSLDTTKATSLGYLMKGFLEDVGNNVSDLYAVVIHSDKVETKMLCVSDETGAKTCIDKAQLDNLMAGAGGASEPASTPSAPLSGGTLEPAPVVEPTPVIVAPVVEPVVVEPVVVESTPEPAPAVEQPSTPAAGTPEPTPAQ